MAGGNEIARLSAMGSLLRPEWPDNSVRTLLTDVALRPYRDIAVALAWVACDQTPDGLWVSRTPKRLLEAGPWWVASSTPERHTPTARPFTKTEYDQQLAEASKNPSEHAAAARRMLAANRPVEVTS